MQSYSSPSVGDATSDYASGRLRKWGCSVSRFATVPNRLRIFCEGSLCIGRRMARATERLVTPSSSLGGDGTGDGGGLGSIAVVEVALGDLLAASRRCNAMNWERLRH